MDRIDIPTKQKENIFKAVHELSQLVTHDLTLAERFNMRTVIDNNDIGASVLINEFNITKNGSSYDEQKTILTSSLLAVIQEARDAAMIRIKSSMRSILEVDLKEKAAKQQAQQEVTNFFNTLNVKLANHGVGCDTRAVMLDHLSQNPKAKVSFSLLLGMIDNNDIVDHIMTAMGVGK